MLERRDLMAGKDISMKGPASPTPSPTLNDYSGAYYIVPENGLVMGIRSSTDNSIHQQPFTNSKSQQFRFAKQSDGTYKIFAAGSNKILTSYMFFASAGQNAYDVVQHDDFGNKTLSSPYPLRLLRYSFSIEKEMPETKQAYDIDQRWRIESVGNNQVKIENKNGCISFGGGDPHFYNMVNGFVSISGSGYSNNLSMRYALVQINANTNRFIPLENGVYRIQPRFKARSSAGNGFVEIGGDPVFGNPQLAHKWASAGDADSNWRFERQSDWGYIITHVATNKVMALQPMTGTANVPNSMKWGSAVVVIQNKNNSAEQKWYITNSGNGFYQFTNVKSGLTYRVQDWDGSKLISGVSDLLLGRFKLIEQ
jgi:hypothetical protein